MRIAVLVSVLVAGAVLVGIGRRGETWHTLDDRD